MRRRFAIGVVASGLTLTSPAALLAASASKDQPVLFTADRLDYDDKNSVVTATGHVEISQQTVRTVPNRPPVTEERILTADSVIYFEKTGVVSATGHVVILEPTGDVLFADHVELTNDMRDGIISDFRMLMSDNARVAAVSGKRENGVETEMQKAVYSPCELCREKPDRPPLWQLRAQKIVHNQDTHDIQYYDAYMDIFGIPILYTPYISMPDPTVKRRSGFLAPTYGNTDGIGFMYGQPYYIVLAPYEDLVLRPIITQLQGPVFATEFRERFNNGEMDLSGSVTQADFTNSSNTVEHNKLRGNIEGTGRFDLDDEWRTGFDLARASDDTYLARYNFRGDNILTTDGFLEGFDGRNYASIAGYTWQGLRPGDDVATTPLVAPMLDYNFVSQPNNHGAYFIADTNFVSLTRLTGTDSHRVSLRGAWHLPYTGAGGDVFEATIQTEGDVYYADHVPDPSNPNGTNGLSGVTGRFLPQLELSWRYPLARFYKTQREVIEPIAAIVVGPNGSNPDKIPNEDSQSIEFDDSNLFSLNPFPGVDRVEGGQRIDYGLNTGIYGENGGSVTGFLGQSYRLTSTSIFNTGSGLEDQFSDFVGNVRYSPGDYYDVLYRFRLSKDNLDPRLSELTINAGPPNLRFSGTYVFISEESGTSTPNFSTRTEVHASISSKLNDYWSVQVATTQDLTGSGSLQDQFNITYKDECFTMIGTYLRRDFSNAEIQPGNTFLVQFVFKNLGQIRS